MGNTDKEKRIIRTQDANTRAHIWDDGDLDPWEDIPEPWEANVEPWEDIPEPWDQNPTNKNATI